MKNKRSLFIVVAMVLLLAVVIGMGGTTFAKYITTDSRAAQSARVAKWGFDVEISDTDKLFGPQYLESGVIDAAGKAIVAANGTSNVVAPGSKGSLSFSINGNAEVASKITIDLASTKDVHLNGTYYPLKWTLKHASTAGGAKDVIDGMANKKLSEIQTYLNRVVEVPANETVDFVGYYELSYVWDFDVDPDTTTVDLQDTQLAKFADQAAAEDAGSSITVDVALTITVEQIQEDVAPTPAP